MDNFQDSTSTSTSQSDYGTSQFRAPEALGYSTIRRKIFPKDSQNANLQECDCSSSAQSSSTVDYSEINKKPKKRVCFWDDVTTTTTSSEDQNENLSWTPSASPSKFPKTNPHFKLPSQTGLKVGLANIRQLNQIRPQSMVSTSSTFSTDITTELESNYSTTSYETEPESGTVDWQANRELRRIVAGLKGFGIKGENITNIAQLLAWA